MELGAGRYGWVSFVPNPLLASEQEMPGSDLGAAMSLFGGTAARTTGGDARLGRRAAARCLIAGIVTMTPKIRLRSTCVIGMRFLAIKYKRSLRSSITVMDVASAEQGVRRTFSTAIDAYLFDSTKDISVLPCGHTIHLECLKEMRLHSQSRYSAMTVERSPVSDITSWLTSVQAAALTIPDKQEMVRPHV
ncbi:RING finger and CHY zinc finger domain-containing protein [Musa troglodytarum]|uniref:RING finger and CHY zinc finger domain-containing protein n=1 Tax=Musa troglodytarum TaxID=320322 RepID=A0A9E7HFC6_9LILI|nr:RING finger and CHY zinc finger domain-containing protein [Musa troglodytarum]